MDNHFHKPSFKLSQNLSIQHMDLNLMIHNFILETLAKF